MRFIRARSASRKAISPIAFRCKGNDQLAEMGASFNTMTENLGRLIVVAKEKERLQSELEIAREVQNQLFPKDVPSSKTARAQGRVQPRPRGLRRLLRFHGAAGSSWRSPSATWPAREFRRPC